MNIAGMTANLRRMFLLQPTWSRVYDRQISSEELYQAAAGKWFGLTCFPIRYLLIPALM